MPGPAVAGRRSLPGLWLTSVGAPGEGMTLKNPKKANKKATHDKERT